MKRQRLLPQKAEGVSPALRFHLNVNDKTEAKPVITVKVNTAPPAHIRMAFLERIDREYQAYEAQIRRLRKRERLCRTEEIAAYRLVYRELKENQHPIFIISFLNEFETPLKILAEAYRQAAVNASIQLIMNAILKNEFNVSGYRLAA